VLKERRTNFHIVFPPFIDGGERVVGTSVSTKIVKTTRKTNALKIDEFFKTYLMFALSKVIVIPENILRKRFFV